MPPEALWPSEIVWQSWLLAGNRLPSFDPSSLRIIARTAVINFAARRAIWYAARKLTCIIEDSSTGYAVYTKEDESIYAILGSDKGASSICVIGYLFTERDEGRSEDHIQHGKK